MEAKIFPHARYDEIVKQTVDQLIKLGQLKGGEYAGDLDRLANFRRNASDCETSMELVWRIYAGKHWDAITQYVKDIGAGKKRERLESLAGRADDLIVYLILFKCIIEEREVKIGLPSLEPGSVNYVHPNFLVGDKALPRNPAYSCAVCMGTGRYLDAPCPHCHGAGQLTLQPDGSAKPRDASA